jgi:hypothetical protein
MYLNSLHVEGLLAKWRRMSETDDDDIMVVICAVPFLLLQQKVVKQLTHITD